MKRKKLNRIQENLRHDFEMRELIDRTPVTKPYVDEATCAVFWGTDVSKEKKKDAVQKT